MKGSVEAYLRLPYPLRVAAASVRGAYLKSWRYGRETDVLVQAARERERWGDEHWQTWVRERLDRVLRIAEEAVPGYRGRVSAETGPGEGDQHVPLAGWPILRKEEIRNRPHAFLSTNAGRCRLFRSHTSGSTGTPLTLWFSRDALRRWYALFEARWRGWNGVSRFDRWAIIGGQRVVPVKQRRPPFWVWNAAMRQLYVSAYHIAPWSAGPIIDAMRQARVVYLWGYASAMTELAREVLLQGLKPPPLRVVISNAEPLLDEQRRIIREAFKARVVNTYGMAEMVAAASECEYGTMHLWPEAGIVEVLDDEGNPCPPGGVGRLICTGLINDAMPLVRYEVGDRGALAPLGTRCPCGRNLPILQQVEGRLDDVVVTPDGRRIGRLDTVFKANLPIRKAQIVQDELDHITVKVEPDHGFSAEVEAALREAVEARIGSGITVEVQVVDEIPLAANAKFRGVISEVPKR